MRHGSQTFIRFRQRTIAGTRSFSRRLREHFHRPFRIHWTTGGFAITWGLDDKIKTPYAYTLDLSVGRELPHGFSIEASYVGRLAHRGLIQEDLAMPLDFGGTRSRGSTISRPAQALAKVYLTGIPTENVTAAMIGPTAAYWQDMIRPLQSGGAYRIRRCTTGGPTGHGRPSAGCLRFILWVQRK